jgi:Skp family chaperone for outer membrane proteins
MSQLLKSQLTPFVLSGCLLLLNACSPAPNTGNTVAVLDLQRVAKETGYSRQINSHMENLRTELQTQITDVQGQLNTQLAEKQGKFGDKPTEQQRQELNQLFTAAKSQLQQAQQQAMETIQQQRSSLVDELFDLLRPYAKRIANERGMNVVLLKSKALVFDNSPESDITDEVIAAVVEAKVDLGLKQVSAQLGEQKEVDTDYSDTQSQEMQQPATKPNNK